MRMPVVDSGAKTGRRELLSKWLRFYFFYWVVMCARWGNWCLMWLSGRMGWIAIWNKDPWVESKGGRRRREVRSRTRRGSLNCTDSLKWARGKESPMQRQKMILRYYWLNCLSSNSSSNGLRQGAHSYESSQWTKLSKGVHTSHQSLTCDDFHGFYIHRKLNNAE